jgi:DNA replication and repair protein RecF
VIREAAFGPGFLGNSGISTHIETMLTAAQEHRRSGGTAAPASRREPVGVTRLVLTDFRNYRSARLQIDAGPVVLTGPNGAGKTNLLEAMSFLSPGRGLRNARLSDIDRRDAAGAAPQSGWAVAATVETRRGRVAIGTGRDAAGGERRAIRVDGEPVRRQAELGERLGVLWLTPAMDRLFVEGPEGRRRLLDRLVLGLDPTHASRVARYEHVMRERSRLLRDGPNDAVWLGALEDTMAAEGMAIAAARREAVERLDRACAAADGAFPRASLTLVGVVEGWLADVPALAAEERFKASLAQGRTADAASGGAAIGPHRSDLAVVHADKGIPADAASTGEQKALLISILLAQAELQRAVRGEPPLLLLDEVAAHLDGRRREALFDILAGHDGQAWLSGTDAAVFAPLRGTARFVAVHDGILS